MKKILAEWYVKNRTKINFAILFIVIIIVIGIIVNILSNYTSENPGTSSVDNSQGETIKYNSISVEFDESATTGEKLTEGQTSALNVLNQFVEYCNEQKIDEAYSLLSEDCKEELYPDVNEFKTSYYDQIFGGNVKRVSTQNWSNNIYRVIFLNDFLSTGELNDNDENVQDYISIVIDDNNNYKLNINGYIRRENIEKTVNNDYMNITVLESDIYMDYQTYTFNITNNTNSTIVLDDKANIDSMYIEDENQNRYASYTHELNEQDLTLNPGENREITIKYYNKYSTVKNINKICFSKIVLNYGSNGSEEYKTIQIDL